MFKENFTKKKKILIWTRPDVLGKRTKLEGDGILDALFWNNMKYQSRQGFNGTVCPWFYIYRGNSQYHGRSY